MVKNKSEKKKNTIAFFSVIIIFIAALGFGLFAKNSSSESTEKIAECLGEKATFYGTDTCPHCQDQKAMFGDKFYKINYVNCNINSDECRENGVTAYPTWIIDGRKFVGARDLDTLGNLADC